MAQFGARLVVHSGRVRRAREARERRARARPALDDDARVPQSVLRLRVERGQREHVAQEAGMSCHVTLYATSCTLI